MLQDADLQSRIPNIAEQRFSSEVDVEALAERQRVKAATLTEAKTELTSLQAQRTEAEETVRQLSGRLHAQRAQNEAVNHALSSLKVENAKLRLAISSPGPQESSRWASTPNIVPNCSFSAPPNYSSSTPMSRQGRGSVVSASENAHHAGSAQGYLDKVRLL